jgi:hypothetical protein
VCGALYFKGGYRADVRDALTGYCNRHIATIDEYATIFSKTPEQPSLTSIMRWFNEEGQKPVEFSKARGFLALARDLPESRVLVAAASSADHKLTTGFF